MRRSRPKARILRHPKLRLTWQAFLWPLASVALLLFLPSALWQVVSGYTLRGHSTYPGELRNTESVVPIVLPAGFILDEIIVSEGAQVRAGQTLAVVDVGALSSRLPTLQAQEAGAKVLSACLLADSPPNSDLESEVPEVTRVAIELSLRECREMKNAFRRKSEVFRARLSSLKDRKQLLDHRSRLLALSGENGDLGALKGRIEQALAANMLDAEIVSVSSEWAAAQSKFEAMKLHLVKEANIKRRSLQEERQRLRDALDEPRILAEDSGTVRRLRHLRSGFVAQHEVEIGQIQSAGKDEFQLRFTVPFDAADEIHPGQTVKIKLLGWVGDAPMLEGEVLRFKLPSPEALTDQLTVEARLSQQSRAALDSAAGQIAIDSAGTASKVTVTHGDQALLESIVRIASANVGKAALQRILREVSAVPDVTSRGGAL